MDTQPIPTTPTRRQRAAELVLGGFQLLLGQFSGESSPQVRIAVLLAMVVLAVLAFFLSGCQGLATALAPIDGSATVKLGQTSLTVSHPAAPAATPAPTPKPRNKCGVPAEALAHD